ncbi:cytoplasmic protein [Cantharellus anzutake]|uniref:cytoplasmic protein n=1 Tax=Cantharellus anzutake TaxID=1750568 RepID=UPI001904EE28|nr:cytoplasmic protein [Cantharellus anzutake]KAF8340548.1 cytoplasmic protein [Cantharellus anzutake]
MSSAKSVSDYLPPLTPADVIACQFSSWYPTFSKITFKATVIRALPSNFREYLLSDGVTLPKGSENALQTSTLSDDELSGDEELSMSTEISPIYEFPELDAKIREIIDEYTAVFPKLNWTSPQDASWVLVPSSPLKCTSPADVYLLLKSSDFIIHDLEPERVFEGCGLDIQANVPSYELELVLKKWYPVEGPREIRCFIRDGRLIALCQRDPNFFDFLNEPSTFEQIRQTALRFWTEKVKDTWTGSPNYVVDIYLTRDLSNAHIMDFNPYAQRTDPILFTYQELHEFYSSNAALMDPPGITSPSQSQDLNKTTPSPIFRVIPSRAHVLAGRNIPRHAHNMMPREALEFSQGRTVAALQEVWKEEIKRAMENDSESDG